LLFSDFLKLFVAYLNAQILLNASALFAAIYDRIDQF